MSPIDRLGWAGKFSVSPEGTTFGVRCNDLAMLDRIRREVFLPSWEVKPLDYHILFSFFVGGEKKPGFKNFTLLYEGSERLARSLDVEEVFRVFRKRFHERVANFTQNKVALGAVALGRDDGAHLYLGPSVPYLEREAGRLRDQGATLLAPAHVFLSDEGLVHPYHNHGELAQRLGIPEGCQALPLSRVWVIDESARPLSPAQTAWHLFAGMETHFTAARHLQFLIEVVRQTGAAGSTVCL